MWHATCNPNTGKAERLVDSRGLMASHPNQINKFTRSGAGEMAHWVQCLQYRHENLSVSPQNPSEEAGCGGLHLESRLWGSGDRWIPQDLMASQISQSAGPRQ